MARNREGNICFDEVKLGGAGAIGLLGDFVYGRKRERLRQAALALVTENDLDDARARFDVAEVYQGRDGALRVNYLAGAFT